MRAQGITPLTEVYAYAWGRDPNSANPVIILSTDLYEGRDSSGHTGRYTPHTHFGPARSGRRASADRGVGLLALLVPAEDSPADQQAAAAIVLAAVTDGQSAAAAVAAVDPEEKGYRLRLVQSRELHGTMAEFTAARRAIDEHKAAQRAAAADAAAADKTAARAIEGRLRAVLGAEGMTKAEALLPSPYQRKARHWQALEAVLVAYHLGATQTPN